MNRHAFSAGTVCVVGALLFGGCASQPDHFYELATLPGASVKEINSASRSVHLSLTVPSLVDRSEIVLNDAGNGVLIYDHERWAAPLADQVTATLSRDLEARRDDLVFGDSRFVRSGTPPLHVNVDIVQVTARRSEAGRRGEVSIVAHWHIAGAGKDAATDQLGGASFTAPLDGDGFAAVAQGYSQVLSQLADALAAAIPGADAPRSALR